MPVEAVDMRLHTFPIAAVVAAGTQRGETRGTMRGVMTEEPVSDSSTVKAKLIGDVVQDGTVGR